MEKEAPSQAAHGAAQTPPPWGLDGKWPWRCPRRRSKAGAHLKPQGRWVDVKRLLPPALRQEEV